MMSSIKTPPPLKITHLSKEFKGFKAVDDVSFGIQRGQIFGLLGPNGAGKTTILSMLVGLQKPTSGTIEIFGQDVFQYPLQAKLATGYVPQELINYSFFNVEQILQFNSGYYGILRNKKRRHELLKKLGLWSHRKKLVKDLSGGMKRRLLIVKSLLHSPKLIFLDEPTAGLDIELRDILWDFVRELKKENISILLTTHYLEEAEKLCDEIAVMNLGRICVQNKTQNIISEFSSKRVTVLLNKDFRPSFRSEFVLSNEGNKLKLRFPHHQSLSYVFQNLCLSLDDIEEISTDEGSLEEAFKNIIKNEHYT